MILVQSDNLIVHTCKKIFITLMGDMCWNLFSSIIYLLAILFSFSSEYKLLLMSSLIKPVLFNKVTRKFFFSFLRADISMDGQKSSAAKLSLMSVTLTDSRLGSDLPTIAQY